MMMADIGYGLLMLLGSWLFLKKKRPDDRSFMEMIFWCGVTTVVFGAMTGSFFGDFLPQLFKFFDPESTFALPALFSPLDDTMAIMVGSLILGALQVFTGMTVSVVENAKRAALWMPCLTRSPGGSFWRARVLRCLASAVYPACRWC